MPMLVGRIAGFTQISRADFRAKFQDLFPSGVEAEYRKLYFDIAQGTYPVNFEAMRKLIPDIAYPVRQRLPLFLDRRERHRAAEARTAAGAPARDRARERAGAAAALARVACLIPAFAMIDTLKAGSVGSLSLRGKGPTSFMAVGWITHSESGFMKPGITLPIQRYLAEALALSKNSITRPGVVSSVCPATGTSQYSARGRHSSR